MDKSRELSARLVRQFLREPKMNKEIKKSEWVAVFFITAVLCAAVLYLKDLEFLT